MARIPKICVILTDDEIAKIKEAVDFTLPTIQRQAQIEQLLGKNKADEVGRMFESNLTYKKALADQEAKITRAVDRAMSRFSQESAEKKEELRKAIAEEAARKRGVVSDEELLILAKGVFDRKYKLDIPLDKVSQMNKLSREAQELDRISIDAPDGSEARRAYGRKVEELSRIIEEVTYPDTSIGLNQAQKIAKEAKEYFSTKFTKEKGVLGNVGEALTFVPEVVFNAAWKGMKASLDASMALRQGFKVLTKSPKTWLNNINNSWKRLASDFQGSTTVTLPNGTKQKIKNSEIYMREWKADIVSRKLYKEALDAGLSIGVVEDFFPTSFAERLPVVGRAFKASDDMFTMFSQGSRMDLFENMYRTMQKNGKEMTPELVKDIATLANSITGRGGLGQLEKVSGIMNKLLFSARFMRSQFDTFLMPFNPAVSPEIRAEALKHLLTTMGTIGAVMATASQFTDVEFDPRSSRFGKIKVPGTENDRWIDVTGGLGSVITLATKLVTGESKSGSGKITEMGSGFGQNTRADVTVNYLLGKLAPGPAVVRDVLKGETMVGAKPTLGSTALSLTAPISAVNAIETFNDDAFVPALAATIADLVGAGQIDYDRFNK